MSRTRFPVRTLKGEVSAERAFEHLERLFATDRESSFSGYARSAGYAAEAMRSAGLERVELLDVPADGVTRFGDWVMPLAWDVEEAFLEVLGENGGRDERMGLGNVQVVGLHHTVSGRAARVCYCVCRPLTPSVVAWRSTAIENGRAAMKDEQCVQPQ